MSRTVPLLDLSTYLSGSIKEKHQFIQDFGNAFHEIGFVRINGHGLSKSLIQDFYTVSNDFFKLKTKLKKKYEIPGLGGQRGYTSFGKEHAKDADVGDLKEFFQIGRDPDKNDEDTKNNPVNIEVTELTHFLALGKKLYAAFEKIGGHLLEAIAEFLNLPKNYFTHAVHNGNSILRSIYYPPITKEPKTAIRAEQHEDINLITLLVGASAGGLQLLNMEGKWQSIHPQEDEIVINVGDMLQRLTNNYLRSTTHRVINPPKQEWHTSRLSIPFFLHPKSNMRLDCLAAYVSKDKPAQYENSSAGEYLTERLREIGLL